MIVRHVAEVEALDSKRRELSRVDRVDSRSTESIKIMGLNSSVKMVVI